MYVIRALSALFKEEMQIGVKKKKTVKFSGGCRENFVSRVFLLQNNII